MNVKPQPIRQKRTNPMSRKSFLILGLVIIQFTVTISAVLGYLILAEIIDANINDLNLLITAIGFGVILHLRFKTVGRRKHVLALCLPFFIVSLLLGVFLAAGYLMLDIFGAHARYFNVIHEWAKLEDPKAPLSWSVAQRMDYVFFTLPAHYLQNWGLFALLWFGSLDPRTPSKSKVIQFMKTGFQRKPKKRVKAQLMELVTG